MAATAYAPNLTDLRGESPHSSLWSNYGTASHLSGRLGSMDALHSSSATATRPRTESYPYGRLSQDEASFDRPQHSSLQSHHGGYANLKRSFSQADSQLYPDLGADLRDEASRLTVGQDHKLLAFRRSQEKSTVVDHQGHPHQLELSAQLHGMFFLSEMPANSTDGSSLQPELTCYRRNLFQISGSFITPRGPISIVNDNNETLAINNMEVTISAIESVDGNPVRLIVIPWKTPPPNSTEANQGADQEPPSLPLIPFQDSNADANGEYAVYPIGWRRLQFRIATANNGRRKELQQHFVLHLKVFGTLSDGSKVVLSETTTGPIVVRGRSPRNFQARKEIPLLGSSAGSRGQALVETGVGVIASALNVKPGDAKSRGSIDMQMPRSSFTFSPPKPAPGQVNSLRSNSYPSWNGHLPVTTMGDSYSKLALSGAPGFTETTDLPLGTSMAPGLAPYGSTAGPMPGTDSVPRYIDNGRATKSPRHHSQQSVHGSMSSADSPADYRYGSYRASISGASDATTTGYGGDTGASSREYYPSSGLTSGPEPSPSIAYTGGDGRPYSFDMHKTGSSGLSAKHESALPGPLYGAGSRGSFESMNNYSWSTN